ncbi:MAG: sugar transferase [Terrisporobacter sp.]
MEKIKMSMKNCCIRLIYNPYILFITGLILILFTPSLQLWEWGFWNYLDHVRINTMIANSIAYISITFILWRFQNFAGTNVQIYILPTITIIYALVFTYFLFTRFGYSRYVLLGSFILHILWFFITNFLFKKHKIEQFAVLPFGKANLLLNLKIKHGFKFFTLKKPELTNTYKLKGIIADLNTPELTYEWEKFLAKCTLNHIPVYHSKQIIESLTGRIQIEHLSENQFGSLLPSPFYMVSKRLLDIIIVICSLPIILPIMLLTALIIKIESEGSILFIQNRVGQGNKDFKIYKFRSMRTDAEYQGAKLAQNNDFRITSVGAWIRRTRIDELPQIWNVLKGDMSLIGPRPEQRTFVNQFEQNIPFYIYRHVVKPGMTGWAQVMQGYASNEDDTIIKIQYDFYYIKHFSFWLDILIFLKTIRVICTGFGAK